MPEIKNNFLQGKMNKDLDDRLLPNGQYRDAQNIQISKSENSDVGAVQNIKGNNYAYNATPLNLASGVETIGYYKVSLTGEIFWFVTNFTGNDTVSSKDMLYATESINGIDTVCAIYYWNANQPNTPPQAIINSFRLNFSKNHPILHVNLIDNLLFWTDNYNQPRRINLRQATGQAIGTFYIDDNYLEDKISVAQYSPPSAPKVTMSAESSSDVDSLHIRDKFVKFAYRFQYENNEYSLMSPFTQTCFHPGKGKNFNNATFVADDAGMLSSADESNAVKETIVESMQNLANRIALFIDLPCNIDKSNVGACDANGILTGTSHNIDNPNPNGSISDGDILLTAKGDEYIVNGGNKTTTLTTSTSVSPSIINDTRLYFFNNVADYDDKMQIKKIQILYSESDSAALKVVETLNFNEIKSDITHRVEPISNNIGKLIYGYKYIYNSIKPIQTLPESELIRVSDVIPVKAHAQEVSGNRVIYGNFKQNRSLDTAVNKSSFLITNGDQTKFNDQYLLSSVKSNREYSVGLVLSDRYGRQSTVFLPTTSTTFVDPKTGTVTNGASSWTHSALKVTFNNTIGDPYQVDTNPLGWYSYKVVIKQSEQEYYNVYAPTIVDNIPSGNVRSWLVLHGDNVNKVPRDVTDVNTETGTQGSQTRLLPKILDLNGTQTQQSGNSFVDVISIGNKEEQGFGSNSIDDFYLNEKGPLLAELPDGYGRNNIPNTTFNNLVVLETDPFKSALDIYYETSTAGLVSHLNAAITETLGVVPSSIALSASSFAEATASGNTVAAITSTDTNSNPVNTPTYSIISITDANGTNRSGAFTISGSNLLTGEAFEFTNTNTDDYTIRIKVTDNSGNTLTQDKSISVTNSNPTINVGIALTIPASTISGTAIRTITGTNGSAKTSANTNNLTFSITNGNSAGKFSINASTGVLSTASSVTSGDSYTLTIQVSDVGNATASDTLSITIGSASRTAFWRSNSGYTFASTAVDAPTLVQVYFENTSGNPAGNLPEIGDTVYDSATGIGKFDSGAATNGTGGYWHSMCGPSYCQQEEALFVFKTTNSGVVVAKQTG
jgi:hypothetical protein